MTSAHAANFPLLLASPRASVSRTSACLTPRPRCVSTRIARLFLGTIIAMSILAQAASVLAAPVVIDDFSAPDTPATYVISLINSDPYVLKQFAALGGERDLLVDVLGSPTSVSAVGMVGAGEYQFGTSGPVASLATLQYDGIDVLDTASSLVNAQGLSVDVTSGNTNNGFRLAFDSMDPGAASTLSVRITATSAGGSASYFGAAAADPNPSNFDVLFTAFSEVGTFSFEAVTSLQFTFNELGSKDADFQLTEISTRGGLVPEPSSFALLAGGSLAWLAVMRHRRKTVDR